MLYAVEPQLEIKHSEPSSYLHFLATGFGDHFTSGSMKQLIDSKGIKDFEDSNLKKHYNKINSYLRNGYNFDSIQSRPTGFYGGDAFISLAVNNSTLEDFEKSLSIFLPYDGIQSYFKLKRKLYPHFSKSVWTPTLKSQKAEIVKVKKILKETNFLDRLKQIKVFYNSEYPWEVPLKVALIPIDDRGQIKRHTSAQNLRDIQVVPYVITKGVKNNMDVVFHEFCHALYEGQSNEVKKMIEDFYLLNSHSHSLFVYRYFNEALATAIGNGWYAQTLYGKLPEDSWYSVGYIDDLAKAYFPLVNEYLEKNKSIDEHFLTRTLEIAKEKLPNGPYDTNSNLIAIRVLSDHKEISTTKASEQLRSKFRIQSMKKSSPIQDDDWNIILSRDNSNTFLITEKSDKVIEKLNKVFSKKEVEELSSMKDFLAIFLVKNRYIFWVNARNKDKLDNAIQIISSKKSLASELELIKL